MCPKFRIYIVPVVVNDNRFAPWINCYEFLHVAIYIDIQDPFPTQ